MNDEVLRSLLFGRGDLSRPVYQKDLERRDVNPQYNRGHPQINPRNIDLNTFNPTVGSQLRGQLPLRNRDVGTQTAPPVRFMGPDPNMGNFMQRPHLPNQPYQLQAQALREEGLRAEHAALIQRGFLPHHHSLQHPFYTNEQAGSLHIRTPNLELQFEVVPHSLIRQRRPKRNAPDTQPPTFHISLPEVTPSHQQHLARMDAMMPPRREVTKAQEVLPIRLPMPSNMLSTMKPIPITDPPPTPRSTFPAVTTPPADIVTISPFVPRITKSTTSSVPTTTPGWENVEVNEIMEEIQISVIDPTTTTPEEDMPQDMSTNKRTSPAPNPVSPPKTPPGLKIRRIKDIVSMVWKLLMFLVIIITLRLYFSQRNKKREKPKLDAFNDPNPHLLNLERRMDVLDDIMVDLHPPSMSTPSTIRDNHT